MAGADPTFEIAEGKVTIRTDVDGRQIITTADKAGKEFAKSMKRSVHRETRRDSKGFTKNLVQNLFGRDPNLWRTLQHPLESIFARPFAALLGTALLPALTGVLAATFSSAMLLALGGGVIAAGIGAMLGHEKFQEKLAKQRATRVRQESAMELRLLRGNLRERLLAMERAGASEEAIRKVREAGEAEIAKKTVENNKKIAKATAATSKTITEMFNQTISDVGESIVRAAYPLVGPLREALKDIVKWTRQMEPTFERLFAAAAPIIPIVTSMFTGMAERLIPTFIQVMPAVVKMFEVLAARAPELTDAMIQLTLAFADPTTIEAFGLILTGFIYTIKALAWLLPRASDEFISFIRQIEQAVNFVKELPERVSRAWSNVVSTVTTRGRLIRNWWNRTWEGIHNNVTEWWGRIVSGADRWVSGIVDRTKALPGKIGASLRELPGRLMDNFVFALGAVLGVVSKGINDIGAWFGRLPGVLAERTERAWNRVIEVTNLRIGQLISFLVALPGRSWRALENLGQQLSDRFTRAWDSVTETTDRRSNQLIEYLKGLPRRQWDALVALKDRLVERFISAWDATHTTVTRKWGGLFLFISGIPRRTWDALVNLKNRLVDRFAAGWAAATGQSKVKVKEFINFTLGIPGRVHTALVRLLTVLSTRARTGWEEFRKASVRKWAEIQIWIASLPGKAVSALGKIGSKLVESGRQLLQGLLAGVRKRIEEVGGLGGFFKTYVVDPIVRAVEKYFQISSPSKVFQGIGMNLIAGLWKGVASSNPQKMITKLFGSMPNALLKFVERGLINVSNIPGRVLNKLGGLFDDLFGGGGGSAHGLVGFAKLAFEFFRNRFPNMTIGGWRARGSVPGSDHPKGKALDLMTRNPLMHRLIIELGKRLPGAKYWISMRKIAMAREGWRARPYHGPSPHTDHVHWSFFHRGTGRRGLPEDILGFGKSGRGYGMLKGEVVTPKGGDTNIGQQGNTYIFQPGSVVLDASSIRSLADVVGLVEGLQGSARQMGARPRVATG